jgi:hypothetical protein
MANERITEYTVCNHFKTDPLFKSVKSEEQKSYNKRVINLLQTASKSGKGIGKPVSFPTGSSYLIVVECKADAANNGNKTKNQRNNNSTTNSKKTSITHKYNAIIRNIKRFRLQTVAV